MCNKTRGRRDDKKKTKKNSRTGRNWLLNDVNIGNSNTKWQRLRRWQTFAWKPSRSITQHQAEELDAGASNGYASGDGLEKSVINVLTQGLGSRSHLTVLHERQDKSLFPNNLQLCRPCIWETDEIILKTPSSMLRKKRAPSFISCPTQCSTWAWLPKKEPLPVQI